MEINKWNLLGNAGPRNIINFRIFTLLTKKLFITHVLFPRFGSICVHPYWARRRKGSFTLSVKNALTPSSSGATTVSSLPMNHGLDPFPTVTVGPPWGQNNAVGGFRAGKITWKYEEIIFNNKRKQTKKNHLLGQAPTKRLSNFIHIYVQ